MFLPFFTVPTHKITNSPRRRKRSQVENGLSVGALPKPQGDDLSAGLLNCCALWTGVLLTSSSTPLWFRAEWPCLAQSCILASFPFPLELCHAVCLSDPFCGC